jgi:hypothetical protein
MTALSFSSKGGGREISPLSVKVTRSLSEPLYVRHKLMAKEPPYATQTQGSRDDGTGQELESGPELIKQLVPGTLDRATLNERLAALKKAIFECALGANWRTTSATRRAKPNRPAARTAATARAANALPPTTTGSKSRFRATAKGHSIRFSSPKASGVLPGSTTRSLRCMLAARACGRFGAFWWRCTVSRRRRTSSAPWPMP